MGINFTDIATTDPVVAATINDRLDELDAAIEARAALAALLLENLFINGGHDVWQRSTDDTAVTTTRKYVADRWAVTAGAGTLANVRRSTTVRTGGRSKYSLEMVGATGVTTVDVDQRIEAALQGWYKQTLYFSCYVYNGSGAAFTPRLYVSTPSAADNWASSTVRNGGGSGEQLQSCADGAWTRVTWSADISAYTNINNGVEFRLRIPSGSLVASDTVRLAEMNLVIGSTATPFVPQHLPLILMQCKRYYLEIGEATGVRFIGGRADVTNVAFVGFDFPSEMRAVPTIALVNGAGNVRVNDGSVNVNVSAISTNFSTTVFAAFNLDTASGLTVTRQVFIDFTSTTTKLTFDAEL